MSCALAAGYDYKNCKGGSGGNKEILFTEAANITAYTITTGVITAITMASTTQFRQYLLDNEMSMAESPAVADPKTDNIIFNHKVVMDLKKFSTTVSNELDNLYKNKLVAIVRTQNDIYRAYGLGTKLELSNFLDFVSGGDSTGKAMEDFNGFEAITFQSKENHTAYEVNSGIIAALLSPA